MGEPTPLEELAAALEKSAAEGPKGLMAAHNQNLELRILALRVLEDLDRRLKEFERRET